MDLDKAIQKRKSTNKFNDKKPDWRDIIECIDSARYAPMAGNNFSLKFILIDDAKKIQELAEASQQEFIAQTKYVIVVCSDNKRTTISYGKRGEAYCRQQAGAAIQNFLLKITSKGLATCWVGHFVDDLVKRTLKIPATTDVEALLPVGYEHQTIKGKMKKKIELDNILYFNVYGNKQMKSPNVVKDF